MKYAVWAMLCAMLLPALASAAIKTDEVTYAVGDVHLKSTVVYDDAGTDKKPGIVVFPEWWGMNDYVKHRAHMLAELGYVAIAADLFGDGKVTDDPKEAGTWAGALKSNRVELRARCNAALDQLRKNSRVDPSKLGAVGYCFGGTSAIELARSGADIRAVVTFHAGLDSPDPAVGKNIKAKILVCHGGDDVFSPEKDIDAFKQEMRQNKVDWQMNVYGNAVHSFSNPGADKHGIPGIAYNAEADHRSWAAMQVFFNDAFGVVNKGQ
jgi:dienelactone hydrolase